MTNKRNRPGIEIWDDLEEAAEELDGRGKRTNSFARIVKITGEVIVRTDKATRIFLDSANEKNGINSATEWFPTSTIEKLTMDAEKQIINCEIQYWILKQKGLVR